MSYDALGHREITNMFWEARCAPRSDLPDNECSLKDASVLCVVTCLHREVEDEVRQGIE